MAEFPLLLGSGVDVVEGEGFLMAVDGLYYQDADSNRIKVGAALDGAITSGDDFTAVGGLSPDDGSGGGYGDPTPAVIAGVEAPVFATGPADTDEMHPGNFSFEYDVENSQILFTALNDDGTVLTGSVALS